MSLRILTEWLGEGGTPVSQSLAEKRATICVCCPMNRAALWWERMFKDPIAKAIREWLALKAQMGLRVEVEEDLHMCKPCGCCLKLKVFVPIDHIHKHSTNAQLSDLPDNCWIPKEAE